MSQAAQAITRSPAEIVRLTPVSQAANGVCYASAGEIASWQRPPVPELQQIVDILGTQMHEMISGKKKPKQALKESERLMERVMKKAGYY